MLHAYGCSWTEGQGCNRIVEDSLSKEERPLYRKENSWVKFLADKLNIPFINNAVSGNANNKIFNQIVSDIQSEKIKSDDFVTIMWSSSLRDYLPFLPHGPKGEWLSWSTKHLMETPDRFFTSTQTENRYYDFFMEEYKKFFLLNLHSDLYYSVINQNYIIFLQQFLNHYKIKYLMCDGIEDMFLGIENVYDKTSLINANSYWGCRGKTMRDFLIEFNDYDMWEYKERWDTRGTQHPNAKGYQLIADELHRFINQNSLI